jgi:hypothetical protein
MTDDDLQLWIFIKCSTKDKTDYVDRGLDVPAPARACEQVGYYRRENAV